MQGGPTQACECIAGDVRPCMKVVAAQATSVEPCMPNSFCLLLRNTSCRMSCIYVINVLTMLAMATFEER